MYGYNGQYPGPMMKVKTGATVHVTFNNEIEFPTTVHWHGLRLDNRFDGIPNVTQKPVKVGESFEYEVYFPDTGIYWYHPHVLEFIQQDLGLYGNMLVQPHREDYYSPVNHEQALILDDILIDEKGMLAYGKDAPTHALMGRFGNVMLVNGKTDYSLEVKKNDVIRFYVTNVANTRTFNMVFNGAKVKVVGSDVSKFEHEEFVQNVPIAVAERYIVEVHYEEPGSYAITNTIQAINHFRGEFYPKVDTLGMVHVSDEETDNSHVEEFNTLRENEDVKEDISQYEEYFDKPVDHRIDMTLSVDGLPLPIMQSMEIDTMYVPHIEWNDSMPMMNWLSTGKQVKWILFDPETGNQNMDISWEFDKGDVVKLRVFNDPDSFHPMNHPFHIHGQRFLVLSIDGVPNSNLVWKDTATIPVGSTVDLLVDMSNPGDWMMHCHIAEHLESGMMFIFTVNE
ncbi:MAG: multicopper oxidase family protein [Balneolaceae bacterium]|nr:multicopper oxidase family protein [Balneolaceae bacterium]